MGSTGLWAARSIHTTGRAGLLGQPRSTRRYELKVRDEEPLWARQIRLRPAVRKQSIKHLSRVLGEKTILSRESAEVGRLDKFRSVHPLPRRSGVFQYVLSI